MFNVGNLGLGVLVLQIPERVTVETLESRKVKLHILGSLSIQDFCLDDFNGFLDKVVPVRTVPIDGCRKDTGNMFLSSHNLGKARITFFIQNMLWLPARSTETKTEQNVSLSLSSNTKTIPSISSLLPPSREKVLTETLRCPLMETDRQR